MMSKDKISVPEESDLDIGKVLKTRRTSKGLSLDDAERATRINKKYLRAIEDGQFSILPSPVALKGFLKNYCGFLGIDSAYLLSECSKHLKEFQNERSKTKIYPRLFTDKAPFVIPNWIYFVIIGVCLMLVIYIAPQCQKKSPIHTLNGPHISTSEATQ